jgi:L-iditol 2-dehydrogenase
MHMPARCCFPIPEDMDAATAALLEPLGVALHAVDLAKLRVGHSVALLGAGPIGLCILQLLRLSGAAPVYVLDKYPWRLALAEALGGIPVNADQTEAIEQITAKTAGRGVDIAIEAAWADVSVSQAAELTRLGGRVVLVGIPADDRLTLKHSTARRKGLTLMMSRRMKHVYPRAIRLVNEGSVDLLRLVSHRFPLAQAAQAFALNADYQDNVIKIIIEH